MELHHLGIATDSIEKSLITIERQYQVESISDTVFDPYENSTVCLVSMSHGLRYELVEGDRVISLVEKGISVYHLCYVVDDVERKVSEFRALGALHLSGPHPAPLFNNQRVAFMFTAVGLIEFLEQRSEQF